MEYIFVLILESIPKIIFKWQYRIKRMEKDAVIDFFIVSYKGFLINTAFECNSERHFEEKQKISDKKRSLDLLIMYGINTLRFLDFDILEKPMKCRRKIINYCENKIKCEWK